MAGLLFGTGGAPLSSKARSTAAGIERIAELGLNCMEVEFVKGVKMSESTAREVGQKAESLNVRLTAHGPYYINLNAEELDKVKDSQARIIQTARVGNMCGVESIVFHAAAYMADSPEKTYQKVKKRLAEVVSLLQKESIHLWIRPEVMGRATQFGTIEEVLKLCNEISGVGICIDFAHWHARNGQYNTYKEFLSVLDLLRRKIGKTAIENMHMHVSGISYSKKGEIKHVNLIGSDFKYSELMRALKERDAKGFVICESPNLEEDALLLQKTYNAF